MFELCSETRSSNLEMYSQPSLSKIEMFSESRSSNLEMCSQPRPSNLELCSEPRSSNLEMYSQPRPSNLDLCSEPRSSKELCSQPRPSGVSPFALYHFLSPIPNTLYRCIRLYIKNQHGRVGSGLVISRTQRNILIYSSRGIADTGIVPDTGAI
jgi:hypothetical protein